MSDFQKKPETKRRPTERKIIQHKEEAGFFEKWFSSAQPKTTQELLEVDLEWLNNLVSMGFNRDLAFNALTYSDSLESALDLLTNAPAKCKVPVRKRNFAKGSHDCIGERKSCFREFSKR
jgi:hypothetical protein